MLAILFYSYYTHRFILQAIQLNFLEKIMENNEDFKTSIGMPYPIGSTVKHNGINFAVHAKDAKQVSLCLFQENNLSAHFKEFVLNKTGTMWHIFIEGLPDNIVFGYKIQRDKDIIVIDPYAKGVTS